MAISPSLVAEVDASNGKALAAECASHPRFDWLDHELRWASSRLDLLWLDRLSHLLGGNRWMLHFPTLGIAPVQPLRDGLFEIVEGQPDAIVFGMHDGPSPSFEQPCPHENPPRLIDALAFYPNSPDRWWLRTGICQVLNRHLLYQLFPEPVLVYSTPLRWLRGLGAGVCPVSREIDALRNVPTLRFEKGEEVFARWLGRLLTRPYAIPTLEVAK